MEASGTSINFDLININQEILSDLNNIVAVYKNDIPTASTAKPFDCEYMLKKNEDECQLASGFVADDTTKYLNYYLNLSSNLQDYNITLE